MGLLAAGRIYDKETVVLSDASIAQDIVTLLVVAPVLALSALRARRGSMAALLCLPGILAFTTYNYVIYAFSIRFGPLFLVWVAVLGLSIFALIGVLATANMSAIKRRFAGRTMTGTAGFLITVAGLFALLWLSEIVPDLLAGNPSRSANDWKVPTNPVHVLDLAFFLPAVIVSGLLLRRRHPLGYATAAGQLVWLALTCLPILVAPLVANDRGHNVSWAVMIPIGVFLVASLAVLGQLLHRLAVNPKTAADPAR
ncbi:MAG: hypothetical protein DLM58_03135 [Pseudonocardiales bacterium]|nr:MAG: hypothetical protein DLM58_03135 [Pseudonocardiales bacterium]